jgi:hypothetical protein
LRIAAAGEPPIWVVSAFGLDITNQITSVAVERLDTAPKPAHHGTAIRITRVGGIDTLVVAEPVDDRQHLRWRFDGIDADARMLFARESAGQLNLVACTDASTVIWDRHPEGQRIYPSPVSELYLDLSDDSGRRKAS